MSPRETPVNLEKDADFRDSAALGAAVGAEKPGFDPDLAAVIETWLELPEAVRNAVVSIDLAP